VDRLGHYERDLPSESRLLIAFSSLKLSRFTVRPICLKSVDSTQDFASRVLRSDREGDLVMSRVQTAGRGREGRKWVSDAGGLWLTITLKPGSELLERLPLVVTESILATLEEYGVKECRIKLPNDVYCGEKKIAGVLIDSSVKGKKTIAYAGIGVNVNNDTSANELISNTASSVSREIGHEVDLVDFTVKLVRNLAKKYDELLSGR
jgi:BirA family transcriptional regulator, biotin operon repressor / biotin---[acetyl-CoA-carboxylase] ligase